MLHEDLNLFGKIVVNTMMVALLWAILVLPASTFSLLRFESGNSADVLGAQDTRVVGVIIDGVEYLVIE